jgi:two-component system, cell cycle response regulator
LYPDTKFLAERSLIMANSSCDRTLIVNTVPGRAESAVRERQGTLTILIGADVGATYPLAGPVVIGRDTRADVALDDQGISRRHCRVGPNHGAYEIEDLGSTNGVYVDDRRVVGPAGLSDGARIRLGNTLLRFALQDPLEREASRRMYEMAVRDGLTAAYNRRYFDERVESEWAFAQRHGTALSVLLIDVDHFKAINDTYGHPAGDEVLRRLSHALRASVRAEDVVARYGGEEFAVIARGIDVAGARVFGERLRGLIADLRVGWEGRQVPVTASIGIAHNHAGVAIERAERLVSIADDALYAAKRRGRNRIEIAASPGRYSLHERSAKLAGSRRRIWEAATTPSVRAPRPRAGE